LARLIRTLTGDDYARTLGRKLTRRRICSITRHRKGGRTYLVHKDGDCVLLDWHAAKR
jgi:hypothetical protein